MGTEGIPREDEGRVHGHRYKPSNAKDFQRTTRSAEGRTGQVLFQVGTNLLPPAGPGDETFQFEAIQCVRL